MFRRSKADEIRGLFSSPVQKGEISVFYLGVSGFIVRSQNHAVLVDPAGMLKSDEVQELKALELILLTHSHLDHFSASKTESIVKATNASVLAEAKVAGKLEGHVPPDKLVSAEHGKAYRFGDLAVTAIQGIHRGPIMLYQLQMGDVTVFHGGDSGYVSLKDYPSQVAIVPVGGMSPTASPENAFKMVADVKPSVALPVHGSDKQKQQFQALVKGSMPQVSVVSLASFSGRTLTLP